LETDLAKTIGDALRAARHAKGLTQEDAAERTGISLEFFSRIERGATLPSVPTLKRLAVSLHVSADVLLGLGRGQLFALAAEKSASYRGEKDKDPPELRRLVRRLRRARRRTIKLLAILASELEA
jgi:transcriptional regulator with XRE-family HTH domain